MISYFQGDFFRHIIEKSDSLRVRNEFLAIFVLYWCLKIAIFLNVSVLFTYF
jgi:hypothetical protein